MDYTFQWESFSLHQCLLVLCHTCNNQVTLILRLRYPLCVRRRKKGFSICLVLLLTCIYLSSTIFMWSLQLSSIQILIEETWRTKGSILITQDAFCGHEISGINHGIHLKSCGCSVESFLEVSQSKNMKWCVIHYNSGKWLLYFISFIVKSLHLISQFVLLFLQLGQISCLSTNELFFLM